ncbi:hypothetical protein BJF83_03605 [Nocardiopsis sp. CNR-923]|nr:hypothetical protein BJF83_03605 [Nocardiopsis sp. CNR-923]
MSRMMASVASARTEAVSGLFRKRDRSTGGPARNSTRLGGNRLSFFSPWYGRSLCSPQCATGTTGTPVVSARRATPVLAVIGHSRGSRVQVPSG